ncbi:HAMP domain-containing histidine kinase [candidate division KSB1 bacterium]|nr:HAMP domain-containing histidine kinase [candidate division KSB1 bacterium]
MEQNAAIHIIVIDDDEVMRMSCEQILVKQGFDVELFDNGISGLERIRQRQPDLLLVDLKMPRIGGIEVIQTVHDLNPDVIIIVITGYATVDTAVDAMKAGAYDFLPKPFTPDELRLIVQRGIERRQLHAHSVALRHEKEKMQRQYITFVSHQLQSPLVAVQQFLEVLKHLGDAPNKAQLQEEWINKSLHKIKDLLALIRDWLKITKIDSGTLIEKTCPIDVIEVIQDIVETFRDQAQEKQLEINVSLPAQIEPILCTEECIHALLENLVVNAIKYNRHNGVISITVDNINTHVQITVRDTGIGIAADELPFIFDEFHRVKSGATKHISGTGLGLTICKKICDEVGGSIAVESSEGEGTTFTVQMPKFGQV